MSVISRILELMENEDISARKLTAELGLANSCISEWKKGKAKPSIDAIIKIAAFFGVTTDWLLLEESKQNRAGRNQLIQKDDGEVAKITVEVSGDELRLLECYKKLDEEDKEYIRCKMIVLNRESLES